MPIEDKPYNNNNDDDDDDIGFPACIGAFIMIILCAPSICLVLFLLTFLLD